MTPQEQNQYNREVADTLRAIASKLDDTSFNMNRNDGVPPNNFVVTMDMAHTVITNLPDPIRNGYHTLRVVYYTKDTDERLVGNVSPTRRF